MYFLPSHWKTLFAYVAQNYLRVRTSFTVNNLSGGNFLVSSRPRQLEDIRLRVGRMSGGKRTPRCCPCNGRSPCSGGLLARGPYRRSPAIYEFREHPLLLNFKKSPALKLPPPSWHAEVPRVKLDHVCVCVCKSIQVRRSSEAR